ncbi:MAG: response regulator [Elusimicrobia bacterium]|nr:response regulator [Elusimicrobiota bacterium]
MNKCGIEIMIVEDNPSDAELVLRVFRKHHLADCCVVLKDGVEALDFLFPESAPGEPAARRLPKVVFLDLKLPRVDGFEVLRRIKSEESTKNIPVVILTSSNQERDIKEAYDLGANSFVSKPIKAEEFNQAVAELTAYWLKLNRLPGQ